MSVDDVLADLKLKITKRLPPGVTISQVEFEGPELVIYTPEPKKFADNGDIVRNLAKDLRKRLVVRPDPGVLAAPEKVVETISTIVPEDAGVSNHYFDTDTGEVIIEAEKPGLVIGRHGNTLREITKEIGWTPKVVRTPPIKSSTVKNVRQYIRDHKDERKELLKTIGKKIHQEVTAKDKWVRVTALGGCREVGRSCFLLSTPETKVLIDCGVNVGSDENGTPYLYIPEVTPINQLDAVVLTHAHLDHSGLVPLLYKYGYEGPVYCTPPTRDLMALLQLDFIDVAAKEGKTIPYPSTMIRETLKHTITLDYGGVTDIAPDMKLTLHNAGHILGSSVVHFHVGDGLYNIAFTGDHKYEKTRLFDPAVNNFPRIETIITESTYGGSRDMQPSRKEAEAQLKRIVQETVVRGGTVLIPAFAVGRSQEVMLVLEEAIRKGEIDKVPVYLDGMIWEATAIHTTYPEYLNSDLRTMIFHKGMNPFLADCFEQVDSQKKRQELLTNRVPGVVLATSGMLNGGPIMEYLRAYGPDERNSLVFVGYQAEGTMGRRLQKGWNEIPVHQNGKSDVIKVNLQVQTADGFSGHSDRKQLMDYIKKMKPRPEHVLTEHGDEKSCLDLASSIYRKFRVETRAPSNLETIRMI
ncbi:MAG: beta-CASP ribonuclease aCPSF1 [Methanosarcinales archaeon]|nr:beta-CASP ribonuclease aCPSF1 [Methanosarcinales archaeon]